MQIPLLGRIGIAPIFVGSALLFYSIHWLLEHPLVALNMPVSLSPGNLTTAELEIATSDYYYIEIETNWANKTFPPGCDPFSVLQTRWTLHGVGQVESSHWDNSGPDITEVFLETGDYSFDATVFPGASCLNAGNPRLLIQTRLHQNDSYIGMTWLSVWCLAIGLD